MSVRNRSYPIVLILLVTVLIPATLSLAGQQASALNGHSRSLIHSKSVPEQLNYQGHLASAADSSAVTATLEMTFRLFDSETKGTELWSETHPAVEVQGGLFQVLLGSMDAFPTGLFDGSELWLQTEVGTEVLSPRKPLASMAYSQMAGEANHAATADQATTADLAYNAVQAQQAVHADTADVCSGISAWIVDGDDIYRTAGKVGIGTDSPAYTLDVDGTVGASAFYGDGSNLTGISGSADADWTISGDTIYHAAGPVGIGTTTPTAPLTIGAVVGDDILFTSGGSNADIKSESEFRIGTSSSSPLHLVTNENFRLTVLAGDGHVGIGTTIPSYPLEVDGAISATTYYGDGSNLTGISGTTDNDWTIDGDDIYHEVGDVGIGTTTPLRRLHVYDGPSGAPTPSNESIVLVENDDSACLNFLTPNTEAGIIRFGDTDDYAEGWISYLHSSDVLMFATKDITSMVLNDDGYLGIGTTAPDRRLHVSNGSIGAGVAHSAADLVVEDDNSTYINLLSPNTELQSILFGDPESSASGFVRYDHSTDKMILGTDGSGRLTIDNLGNVGIGNSSPSYKLDVQGAVDATTYYGDGSNLTGISSSDADWTISGSDMYSAVAGNVGIGTSNPVNKLDVEGRMAVGASYSGSSTAPSNGMIIEGTVGIGTSSPSVNYKLQVEGGGSYGIHGEWNGASGGAAIVAINGGTGGEAIQAFANGTGRSAIYARGSSGVDYAVWGSASGATYAGYFTGDLHFTGTMTGGTKSFLIDHPLDPLNKTLMHYCIESPDPLLVYSGKAAMNSDGQAVVQMPDYFVALTREDQARINLTPVGRPFLTGAEWNAGNTSFTVYGDPDREVFYTVYADRDDPVMRRLKMPVVAEKGNGYFEKGKLLYPEAYGYPASLGVDYENNQNPESQ